MMGLLNGVAYIENCRCKLAVGHTWVLNYQLTYSVHNGHTWLDFKWPLIKRKVFFLLNEIHTASTTSRISIVCIHLSSSIASSVMIYPIRPWFILFIPRSCSPSPAVICIPMLSLVIDPSSPSLGSHITTTLWSLSCRRVYVCVWSLRSIFDARHALFR